MTEVSDIVCFDPNENPLGDAAAAADDDDGGVDLTESNLNPPPGVIENPETGLVGSGDFFFVAVDPGLGVSQQMQASTVGSLGTIQVLHVHLFVCGMSIFLEGSIDGTVTATGVGFGAPDPGFAVVQATHLSLSGALETSHALQVQVPGFGLNKSISDG